MIKYVARRVAMAAVVIYIVVTLSFFMVRLLPGNAIEYLETQLELEGTLTPQQIQEKVQAIYGLSPRAPLWKQYFVYVGHAFQGNFGTSVLNPGVSVLHIVAGALPWTIFSVGVALLISFIFGIVIGAVMAVFQDKRISKFFTLITSLLSAIPLYLVAIVLIYVLTQRSSIFPTSGNYGLNVTPGLNGPFLVSVLSHAILPIAAYVITAFGGWALTMKGAAISTLGSEYVRAAEASGLGSRRVGQSYVGRNSMLPMTTSLAMAIGFMFGGSVFIETYFIYPGIGYYMIEAVDGRDYTLMMGCFILITITVVVANLLVDLLYPWIDPRIAKPGAKVAARIGVVDPILPVKGMTS
ncbi:MAG: ABC transporter permease [Actinobacteria bacterium]|nr:ABC transporter permease [Actinomycetota bacterium]